MWMLTQAECGIPTALSCATWEASIAPVIDPAVVAVNTVVLAKTVLTIALPAGTAGDSVVVMNASGVVLPVSPIADSIRLGEVALFTHNGINWARG